jgi:murein DD-endopeptidase MepM/ murein hydrolase activator NlpD
LPEMIIKKILISSILKVKSKYIVLHLFLTIFLLLFAAHINGQSDSYIERTRLSFKEAFIKDEPAEAVKSWKVPFQTEDRFKLNTIKVISVFGAPRDSYLKGHIHTAADIIPEKLNIYNYIYPMADGVICSIHLGHPHKTIVIKHRLPDSTIIYTSYKHLQEIYVTNGMQVDQDTKLAGLYTKEETKKQGGSYDHLHLEIRKSFYDYGCASWLTMNRDELNKYFYNPVDFMKKYLG